MLDGFSFEWIDAFGSWARARFHRFETEETRKQTREVVTRKHKAQSSQNGGNETDRQKGRDLELEHMEKEVEPQRHGVEKRQ
jgi:hypothetical protein